MPLRWPQGKSGQAELVFSHPKVVLPWLGASGWENPCQRWLLLPSLGEHSR